jgi:hypothetical protein
LIGLACAGGRWGAGGAGAASVAADASAAAPPADAAAASASSPGVTGAAAAGAACSAASVACRHCEKSRIIRLEMSSIIPPRPKRASRPVMVKSVTASTVVPPSCSESVLTIVAFAPPWPRLSEPLADRVAVCVDSSESVILIVPR